ncbi:MAG: hypothetical protein J6039_04250 [Alphaproteobacteria bacterium]|nr:hypothetical protein [Alphaproteobacteria bacterium]
MCKKIIARRDHGKDQAFVKVNSKDCKWQVSVYGRQCYVMHGPDVIVNTMVPWQVMSEIESMQTWRDDKSPMLETFIQECYQKAAERDEWFKDFVNP